MSEIRIPEEILDIMEKLDLDARSIIEIVRWASANPSEAQKFIEEYRKLNGFGRRNFKYYNRGDDPLSWIKRVLEKQMEYSRSSSLYRKIVSEAKKGGYSFITKAGVTGTLKVTGNEFHFTFDVQGVKVECITTSLSMSEMRETLEDGNFPIHGTVYLEGKELSFFGPQVDLVREAVKRNVDPYVVLAIG
jgi:hypothetical protein